VCGSETAEGNAYGVVSSSQRCGASTARTKLDALLRTATPSHQCSTMSPRCRHARSATTVVSARPCASASRPKVLFAEVYNRPQRLCRASELVVAHLSDEGDFGVVARASTRAACHPSPTTISDTAGGSANASDSDVRPLVAHEPSHSYGTRRLDPAPGGKSVARVGVRPEHCGP